jgi:glutamyl/glutaminyl-tRNA synthetase
MIQIERPRKKEYIEHIQEIVHWMGWGPFKITYSGDYFQELYDLAVELIKCGHAYVDHQTPEEVKEYREKKKKKARFSMEKSTYCRVFKCCLMK